MHPDLPPPSRPRPPARTVRPLPALKPALKPGLKHALKPALKPALKVTLTTALAAAVVVGPLGAVPASAVPTGAVSASATAAVAPTGTITAATPREQLTYEDHGFPGYFSELSVVEDSVATSADHFTVQADFCLHPQAAAEDRLGFDIIWDTPISDWEELLGMGDVFTSRVPVTDAAGRTVMTATMVFDTSGPVDEEDMSWELKTSVDLTPVPSATSGATSSGGCGTLELPVAAPLMLSDVAAAQPQVPGAEEFDPYAYYVQFVDPEGRRSEDEVHLEPTELPQREAWIGSTLNFTGSTNWLLLSPAGPADPAQGLPTVTLQDDTLCEEPYQAAILNANTLEPLNLEPDLDVSCEGGVKTFTLQNRLRADRQLIISQQDPRPGARPATAELTVAFTLNGITSTRSASVTSAASTGRLTGPWRAPELCAAEPFTDNAPGSHYYREVRWMQCWEITQGYASDHTYRKKRSITRGESVAFLFRYAMSGPALPLGSGGDFGFIGEPGRFWDVEEDSPFAEAIDWAALTGVTQGYSDGSFGISRPVTRGELAAFVYRAVNGGFDDDGSPTSTPFSDVPAGHPFDTEIAWLAQQQVVRGYGDGTFRPGQRISRGEVARMLYQVHDRLVRRH